MVAIMHILLCGVLKHEYCRARTDGVVLGHNHAIGAQLAKQGLGTSGSGALFRRYAYRIQNRVVDIDVADSRRLDPSLFYIWSADDQRHADGLGIHSALAPQAARAGDRKSTRLNSSN